MAGRWLVCAVLVVWRLFLRAHSRWVAVCMRAAGARRLRWPLPGSEVRRKRGMWESSSTTRTSELVVASFASTIFFIHLRRLAVQRQRKTDPRATAATILGPDAATMRLNDAT